MKLKEFQATLLKQNIDLSIMVGSDPNITYFTQQTFSQVILCIYTNQAQLLVTKLDQPQPLPKGISTLPLTKTWEKEIAAPAAKKIGINYRHLTLDYFEKFKKIFPQAVFIDISPIINGLRAKKIPEELMRISKACQITSNAYEAAVNKLSACKLDTERQIASFLEEEMKSSGADLAFPTIAAAGKNAATPHHLTGTGKLKRGFLVLDFGARYKNYCADMTRTVFLGKPTKQEKSNYNLLLACQQSVINHISENRLFSQLDFQARKVLGSYSKYFVHSLGHGIGIEVHEAPVFSAKNAKVENKQTFTIEPGIYLKGRCGIRIEDTLSFNVKPRLLTTATKDLMVLPF